MLYVVTRNSIAVQRFVKKMPFLELHLIVKYSSNRSDSIDIIDSTDISDSYEKLLI